VVWQPVHEEITMHVRNQRRATVAVLAFALAGLAIAPAADAHTAGPDALQGQVNAIKATGDVGVVAEVTGPGGHSFATAGLADLATGTPARPDDSFRIGSSTKTFVATVILQLVAEGKLSLSDTVAHWLPGVVSGNGNDGGTITIRELLQHTSGLYDYINDLPELTSTAGFEANRYTTYTPAQLVAIAMQHAPDFAPGTNWEYSNTNYVLLGMVINKATGHTWQDEVTTRIIKPLALHHTIVPGTSTTIPGPHLDGYSAFGSGPAINVTALNPSAADAAGEIISTTADLTTFYTALIHDRLLPKTQLTEMETTVPAPGLQSVWPGVRYGLGLMWIPLSCGGGYYAHGGDLPGYSTRTGITPNGNHIAIVERTGDGNTDSEQAMNTLIDQQLCQTSPA
jgi:D-alanyl-D-alanine carboxypeptidase